MNPVKLSIHTRQLRKTSPWNAMTIGGPLSPHFIDKRFRCRWRIKLYFARHYKNGILYDRQTQTIKIDEFVIWREREQRTDASRRQWSIHKKWESQANHIRVSEISVFGVVFASLLVWRSSSLPTFNNILLLVHSPATPRTKNHFKVKVIAGNFGYRVNCVRSGFFIALRECKRRVMEERGKVKTKEIKRRPKRNRQQCLAKCY